MTKEGAKDSSLFGYAEWGYMTFGQDFDFSATSTVSKRTSSSSVSKRATTASVGKRSVTVTVE